MSISDMSTASAPRFQPRGETMKNEETEGVTLLDVAGETEKFARNSLGVLRVTAGPKPLRSTDAPRAALDVGCHLGCYLGPCHRVLATAVASTTSCSIMAGWPCLDA